MLATILNILRDPVPHRGAIGFLATITLERLNSVIGLLVGLATLVYLCLKIRKEFARKRHTTLQPPARTRNGQS